MSKNIEDLFSDLFGPGSGPKRPDTAAQPRQYRGAAKDAQASLDQMGQFDAQITQQVQAQLDELRRMTSELDLQRIDSEVARDFGTAPVAQTAGGTPKKKVGIEGFDDLLPELRARVLGQDVFLERLIIAFKRPFVAGFPENGAKNAIFLHGQRSSGKHTAVDAMADILHQRGVLDSPKVRRVDLALYPGQGEEKLFLQDLYMALSSEGEVVVFDNYRACHPAFLGQLAGLIIHGRVRLSSRYVLQNGRLIDAGNALTADIIGHLDAGGKYLILIDEKGPSNLAGSFGAALVDALGDTCQTGGFTSESLTEIARDKMETLSKRARERLAFDLTCGDCVGQWLADAYSEDSGVGSMVAAATSLFKALAQHKLEGNIPAQSLTLKAENGTIMAGEGETAFDLLALLPGGFTGQLHEVKAEMDDVVGLTEIKQYIFDLEDHYKVQAMRKAEGFKAAPVAMHMIFTGNPGTGKTTIARLVSKYLKAIGVLSGGQLIEVTRADLVGKYVGHTAPLTTQVIKSAIGGVLFIDEAYALYRGEQDSFGLEAIDTLVKGIEDNRDNLIVVLAGYSLEMAEFMTANSGLKSRFPNIIEFPDYSGEELRRIANLQAKSKGYVIEDEAQDALLDYFNIVQAMDSRDSGNGRLARNVVERAILDQSRRIVAELDTLNILRRKDFDLFEG